MVSLRVFKGLAFPLLMVGLFVLFSGVFSYVQAVGTIGIIGYYIPPGVTSFSNSDTISAEDVKGDDTTVLNVYGVYSDHNLTLFENTETGDISALGQVGDAVSSDAGVNSVFGVFIGGSAATFTNAGEISADASAGNASGDYSDVYVEDVSGVYFDNVVSNFTNSGTGTISVTATAGDASGNGTYVDVDEVYGAYFNSDVDIFSNVGTINVTVNAGSASGDNSYLEAYDVYGVDFEGSVGNFENSGNILVNAKIGDNRAAENNDIDLYDIYGVYASGEVNNFTNSGTIEVNAVGGTGYGGDNYYSDVYVENIYGIKFNNSVMNFDNSGDISVTAKVGDSEGDDTYAGVEEIYGAYFSGDVTGFANSKNITVSAQAGDVNGFDGAESYAEDVYGTYFDGAVMNFDNSGTISATAHLGDVSGSITAEADGAYSNADAWAGIDDVVGAYFNNGVDSFTNSGTISASAQMGNVSDSITAEADGAGSDAYAEAWAGIDEVAGAYFEDYVDSFTNSGTISASAQVGNITGLSATASATNGSDAEAELGAGIGGIFGTYFDDEVGTFDNSGTISATAHLGDVSGSITAEADGAYSNADAWAGIYGVFGAYFDNGVDSFTNSGTISASAQMGNVDFSISTSETNGGSAEAELDAGVYGVAGAYFDGDVSRFTNSGTVSTTVQAGSASGDDSSVWAFDITGVSIWGNVNSFTNTGDILVDVSVGDASGSDSLVSTFYAGNYHLVKESYNYWNAGVYAVYIGNNVDVIDFHNSGNIKASIQAGSATGEDSRILAGHVLGVDIGSSYGSDAIYGSQTSYSTNPMVGSFKNEGSIAVSSQAGDAEGTGSEVDVFTVDPVWVDYSTVNSFENSGDLIANGQAGSAIGNNSTVIVSDLGSGFLGEVDNFDNSGNIITTAVAGDAKGTNSEIGMGTGMGWFAYYLNQEDYLNPEYIVSGISGNAIGDGSDFGIAPMIFGILGDVTNFTNSGAISASAQAGDASGNGSYIGVGGVLGVISDDIVNFTNSGTISASAQAGDASGDGSGVEIYSVAGVAAEASNFTNSGTISASVQAGNASGDSSTVDVGDVYGSYFNNGVSNFTNTGSITTQVSVGSEIGADSTVEVSDVAGVYINGGYTYYPSYTYQAMVYDVSPSSSTIVNDGAIGVGIKAGKGADISYVAGVVPEDMAEGSLTNNGVIDVAIDAPEAESVTNVAGIYVSYSGGINPVHISNPGWIRLWTNAKNADIRTLRIESSYVQLDNKFSILFGQKGIDKRPIYLESSWLNLNDTDIVAGIRDAALIKWNHPYYLIENNNGTVNGEFDKVLTWRYKNEDLKIKAYWWDPNEKGEDAAVAFNLRYKPKHSVSALGVHSALTVADTMLDRVIGLNGIGRTMMAGREIFLAQNDKAPTASDVGPSLAVYTKPKNTFYLYPFYTRIDGDDLKYDADIVGGVMGLEHIFGERYRVGLFGGYAYADVDYGVKGARGEDQDIYMGGLYVDRLAVEGSPWYVGLAAAAYHANHYDYDGRTGLNYELKEDADYDSWGMNGRVTVGYQFSGDGWRFMPNVGLGITYWDLNGFTTDVHGNSAWERHYSGDDDTYGTVMAGVTGIKYWGDKETRFSIGGLLRAEETIGDNDIEIEQSIPALRTGKEDVEEEVGDFSMLGQLELGLRVRDRYTFSLSGGAKYNSDYAAYGGRLTFKIAF